METVFNDRERVCYGPALFRGSRQLSGLAGVLLSLAVLCGLSAFYGTDYVYDKIFEFTVRNLSKVVTQGPFLTTVACCLIVELFLVGYEKSSLKRLLNPSKSGRSDLYLFFSV